MSGFALAALAASFLAPPVAASPQSDEPADGETCYETRDFSWSSNSYLRPGEGNVTRDPKIIDEGGDVSIDGWSSGGTGIDGWHEGRNANFRVVVGTLYDARNVNATMTFEEPEGQGVFKQPGFPVSPAGGATPQEFKQVTLTNLVQPTLQSDGRTIDWNVTADRTMPGGSSSHFMVQADTSTLNDLGPDDPIKVNLVLTGEWDVPVECEDEQVPDYGPVQPGDLAQCELDWRVASTIDRRLEDYSNAGYRWAVHPSNGKGYVKAQHWSSGDGRTLYWRVPFATEYAIEEGTQIVLSPGENWTINPNSFSDLTGQVTFQRFTGVEGYEEIASGVASHTVDDQGRMVVTLPAMPANSHVLFTFTGTAAEGVDPLRTGFDLDGTVNGEYTQESLEALECIDDPDPTDEPTETETPTDEPTETEPPTDEPTETETETPTDEPTETETETPTDEPTETGSGDGTDTEPEPGSSQSPTTSVTSNPSRDPSGASSASQPVSSSKSEESTVDSGTTESGGGSEASADHGSDDQDESPSKADGVHEEASDESPVGDEDANSSDAEAAQDHGRDGLARTGAHNALLIVGSLLLLGAGTTAVLITRRYRS